MVSQIEIRVSAIIVLIQLIIPPLIAIQSQDPCGIVIDVLNERTPVDNGQMIGLLLVTVEAAVFRLCCIRGHLAGALMDIVVVVVVRVVVALVVVVVAVSQEIDQWTTVWVLVTSPGIIVIAVIMVIRVVRLHTQAPVRLSRWPWIAFVCKREEERRR